MKKKDYFKKIAEIVATGEKPKGAKDGSIPTHPVIPVPPLLEAEVLKECLSWFKVRRIYCTRHDCGAGDFGYGYAVYGIKGAGDIIGLLPNGRHFEIETKKGKGGRQATEQQDRQRDVRENNGLYFIVHGVEELEYYMKEYL